MPERIFILQAKGNYVLKARNNGLYADKTEKQAKDTTKRDSGKKKEGQAKKPETGSSGGHARKPGRKSVSKETDQGKQKKTKKTKKKQSMIIQTVPRYFFVWETESYTEEKWRTELLGQCRIQYGNQKKEEIQFRWQWDGLLQNTAGEHKVEVSVEGGDWTIIPVTLVQESTEKEKTGYIRFCTPDTDNTTDVENEGKGMKEVWYFTPQT